MADFSLPSWLEPKETPWQAFLSGAQAGSSIAANHLRAVQMRDEIQQQNRQYALQMGEFELRRTLADSTLKEQMLDQQIKGVTLQDQATLRTALKGLSFAKTPEDVAALQGQFQFSTKQASDAWESAISKNNLYTQFTRDRNEFDTRLTKLDAVGRSAVMSKWNGAGLPGQEAWKALDTESDRVTGIAEDRKIAMEGRMDAAKSGTLQKDINTLDGLRSQLAEADAIGDTEGAQRLEENIAVAEGKILGSGQTIETTSPDGTVTRVKLGGKAQTDANAPTVGFKGKLQEQSQNYADSFQILDHISQNITSGDVGLRGVAKEAWARWGGQFGAHIDPETMDTRESMKLLRASLYKSLRSDSNITDREQQQIISMLPSVGISESLPNAMSALNAVRRELIFKTRAGAARLGTEILPYAMTSQEKTTKALSVKQLFLNNKISAEDAKKAIKGLGLDVLPVSPLPTALPVAPTNTPPIQEGIPAPTNAAPMTNSAARKTIFGGRLPAQDNGIPSDLQEPPAELLR